MFVAGTQHMSGPLTDLSVVVRFQRFPGSAVCPGSDLGETGAGDARGVAAVGWPDESLLQAASSRPQPNTNQYTVRT